jgi:hypothetical protein
MRMKHPTRISLVHVWLGLVGAGFVVIGGLAVSVGKPMFAAGAFGGLPFLWSTMRWSSLVRESDTQNTWTLLFGPPPSDPVQLLARVWGRRALAAWFALLLLVLAAALL